MSKNCCQITLIPENMREWAVNWIFREISDNWNPSLVRKTKEGVITICDDKRDFSFVEYTHEFDWEWSALLLDEDTSSAIDLYRFWIASLIINKEEKITWNNNWSNWKWLSQFEISRQIGVSYMSNCEYDGRSMSDIIELIIKETWFSKDYVIDEIFRLFPQFICRNFDEIKFLPENDPWYA